MRSWFKNTGLRSPNVGDQSKTREFWILGARWEAFLEMGKDLSLEAATKMIAVGLRILREEGVTHGRSGGSSMSCRDLNSEHQFQKHHTGGKKDDLI